PDPQFHWRGPIGRYARELDLEHVHVSERRFVEWLPWADRILLDFPSTALYETALVARPFRLLVHTSLRMRAGAMRTFAAATAEFDTATEAAALAREFAALETPPRVALEPEGPDLCDLVERLSLRTRRQPSLSRWTADQID